MLWLVLILCGEIRFPDIPDPPPAPAPKAVTELLQDQWYVIESTTPVVVLGSPTGLVTITAETGPMKMRGQFVDGKGIETRTYSSPYLYTVGAAGAGVVELLVIPPSVESADDVIRKTLTVSGTGPKPPPDPDVDPDPDPDPEPAGKLMVLIVEETDQRGTLPASQIPIFAAKEVRDFLKAAGDLRILDEDQDIAGAEPWLQAAWKEPRAKLPWIVLSNGQAGYSGPLPASVADMMVLLRKYHADNR